MADFLAFIQNQGSEALVVTDKSFFFVLGLHRNEDDILIGHSLKRKAEYCLAKGNI